MLSNLSCSALKVFPLWFILIQQGKVFSVLAIHPKSILSSNVASPMPWFGQRASLCIISLACDKIQRCIVWTSSPTVWLISSFSLQFSVSEACMRKANEINISDF